MSFPSRKPPSASLADVQPELKRMERRLFLKGGLSLGALTLLTGCDLADEGATERALMAVSRFNDRVQAALFNPHALAPTYAEADITRPFPFNAFYGESAAPVIDGGTYRLEVAGLVSDRRSWTISELRALPQETQITRHVCVEGWSAIGKWSGVRFSTFLDRIGADRRARYVGFRCADGYYTSLDMASALHPQTQLTLDFPEGPNPTKYGYPVKVRVPTKLGFKNPKFVTALFVTNDDPGGYWEDQGYNWFSGL